jgi:hypothetical protein
MESLQHLHLKNLALYWLKQKTTDLVAAEVKLFVKRKKLIADAVGVNLKRKEVRFIEVKVSKQDLKRDVLLSDPSFGYHHLGTYAYIMSPLGVLEDADIPAGYGWLVVDENDVITVIKNPKKNTTPKLRFDTILKRTCRALTNCYLFKKLA